MNMNKLDEKNRAGYLKLIIIVGLVVLFDQASKLVILKTLPLHHSVTVISGFFDITHVQNPGGAFGFLSGQSPVVRNIIFIVVSFLATCLIFYFYKNTPKTHPLLSAAFALILGGAAGNLIDRVRFGKVIDFLDFYIGNLHWPAFNIADSAISIGMTILLFHMIFKKMPE